MQSAKRIVSLISSATEILFEIGAGERVVAVSHECDYPPQTKALPRATFSKIDSSQSSEAIDQQVRKLSEAGESLYELDRDLLRRLQPDLIITQAQCDVCAVRYADVVDFVAGDADLKSTRIVALSPASIQDVLVDISTIGDATGDVEQASCFRRSLETRIGAVRSQTQRLGADARPRTACIEWVEPLMLAANWTPELVDWAGGNTDQSRQGKHSVCSEWNALVDFDPEVLLIALCGFDLSRSLAEAAPLHCRPDWGKLTAVRNGRVWVIDGNAYLNRSGPRLVDSLEIVAHLIQPECSTPPLVGPVGAAWVRLA